MTNEKWTPPKGWRWMPGMAFQWASSGKTCRVLETKGTTTTYAEAEWDDDWCPYSFHGISPLGICPDLTDPATLGCVLALVREAWGDKGISTVMAYAPDMCGQWSVHSYRGGRNLPHRRHPTEAAALLAALEAAP